MQIAENENLVSIAFPCISTGVYHYPKPEAAKIALETISKHLNSGKYTGSVTICCFSEADADIYRQLLGSQKLFEEISSEIQSILINAVYFKGVWEEKFIKRRTREGEFTNYDGSKSTASYMRAKMNAFGHKGKGLGQRI